MKTETEVTLGGVNFLVTYHREPLIPGRLWGPPEDCFPPEGGELEIEGVRLVGADVDLIPFLAENVLEQIGDSLPEKPDDRY